MALAIEARNSGKDNKTDNELDVKTAAEDIKNKINTELVDRVSKAIVDRVVNELEEQHYPKEDSDLDQAAKILLWSRKIAMFGLAAVFLIISALSAMALIKSLGIVFGTFDYASKSFEYYINLPSQTGSELYKETSQKAAASAIAAAKNSIISDTLSVLDLILITSLTMMVFIGGFENVISRVGSSHDYPVWIGKLEIGQLKIKVAASIIIISSLHLLLAFLSTDFSKGLTVAQSTALLWTSIIHIVFVISALMLAFIEKLSHD